MLSEYKKEKNKFGKMFKINCKRKKQKKQWNYYKKENVKNLINLSKQK